MNSPPPKQDEGANAFRAALGKFATGVTIITTSAEDGAPVGVTASSFNSVSLDPPMVLWSLAKSSGSLKAFARGGEFAVHVLSARQADLSARFASKGADKFAGLEFERGEGGAPLLPHCAARFRCRTAYQYEGGDHIIFVGEVLDYQHDSAPPLVFHGGRYAEARERHDAEDVSSVDLEAGRFTSEFLPLLLSRAHRQISQPVKDALAETGMSETEYLTLTSISMHGPLSGDALRTRLGVVGQAPSEAMLEHMQHAGWLKPGAEAATFELTEAGRERFFFVLARAKERDDALRERFSPSEMADLRRLLKKLIGTTASE